MVEVKSLHVRCRLQMLDCMPSSEGIPLHALKWAKDLFGLSTFIHLKSSNLGDANWSERSVGALWGVGSSFSHQ